MPPEARRAKGGGAGRDRTDDLKLAKLPLSQLSYGPPALKLRGASPQGKGWPAIRSPKGAGWWAWEDLNFRPHAYQARALTN